MALSYSTNLSVLNFKDNKISEIWKNFSYVLLVVSVDAIGELGEYVRHGLKWDRLKKNIAELKQACPHVACNIGITVSVLNIHKLVETIDFFLKENWVLSHQILLNILHGPEHWNIQILPSKIKKEIEQSLRNYLADNQAYFNLEANKSLATQMESVILFMNSEDKSHLMASFKENLKFLDEKRGEDAAKHLPWIMD